MSFKKTLQNIPIKARVIVIVITVALLILTSFAFRAFFKKNEILQSLHSGAEVKLSSNKVKKQQPGEQSIIPINSPAGVHIAKEKGKVISDAKRKGSHIDMLEFNNNERIIKKADEDIKVASYSTDIAGLEDVDDELDSRRVINQKRIEVAEAKKAQALEQIKTEQLTVQRTIAREEKELEDSFLADEFVRAGRHSRRLGTAIAKATFKRESIMRVSYRSSDKKGSASNNNSKRLVASNQHYSSGEETSNQRVNAAIAKIIDMKKRHKYSNESPKTAYDDLTTPYESSHIEKGKPAINAGAMYYSVLEMAINTDELGPIKANIPSFIGGRPATLLGEAVRNDVSVRVRFNRLIFRGKTYSDINALALDTETLRPAIADDVDRHIFDRYFKLALAAAGEGVVKVLTTSSTTRHADGSSEQTSDKLDAGDTALYAAGTVAGTFLPVFKNNFNRPPTVTTDKFAPVIVMFMTDVNL